jgi:hypothetical protein
METAVELEEVRASADDDGGHEPIFDHEMSNDIARQIRAKFRRCWTNAACAVALLGDRGRYVEGWIVVNRNQPVVIEHGWCELERRVIDPTYTPYVSHLEPPLAYVAGMYFGAAEAAAALQRGTLPIAWIRSTGAYERAFESAWLDAGRRITHEGEPPPETRLVNCRREESDVFIGRPSKWHNPFHIGPDGSREQVVAKYRQWVIRQPRLLRDVRSLRGKTLGSTAAVPRRSPRRFRRSGLLRRRRTYSHKELTAERGTKEAESK